MLYNTASKIHQANQPDSPASSITAPRRRVTWRRAVRRRQCCQYAGLPISPFDWPASWAQQSARQQTNNRATASYSTANQASGVFYARKSNFFTCTRNVSEGGAIAANRSNSHTWRCYSLVCCQIWSSVLKQLYPSNQQWIFFTWARNVSNEEQLRQMEATVIHEGVTVLFVCLF